MDKAPDAFRTISEVSEWLDTPTHVLRFWESRFPEVAPVKRAGGRRYYRVEDMRLLGGIKKLLHEDGVTIKALQDRIKADGAESVAALSPALEGVSGSEQDAEAADPQDVPGGNGTARKAASPTRRMTTAPSDTQAHPAPPDPTIPSVPPENTARPEPLETARPPTPSDSEPSLPPLGTRQRSLSLGDAPPPEDTAAPQSASFKRHPASVRRNAAPKPEPKTSTRPHPSRPGLFLYDDSDLHGNAAPDVTDPAEKPGLAPLADLPADVEDDCPATEAVPVTAELRAMVALAATTLPTEAAEPLSRLRALRDRWA